MLQFGERRDDRIERLVESGHDPPEIAGVALREASEETGIDGRMTAGTDRSAALNAKYRETGGGEPKVVELKRCELGVTSNSTYSGLRTEQPRSGLDPNAPDYLRKTTIIAEAKDRLGPPSSV